MTSYRFLKRAAIETEIYLLHMFKNVEFYLHTKFQWDISIHGWDKTTSGFGKRTAAILKFYFQFRFSPNFRHRHVFLHRPAKFRQNRTTLAELWRHDYFSRWRPAAILNLIWIILDHPRAVIVGLSLVVKFGLDPITVLEIWRFLFFGVLAWNYLSPPIFGGYGGIFSNIWSPIILAPIGTILARKHVVWAIKREDWSSGSTWAHDREQNR